MDETEFWAIIDSTRGLTSPAMTNVPAGTPLANLVVDRREGTLEPLGDTIAVQWIQNLHIRLNAAATRLRRLHYKSLGSLLAFQDRLAAEFRDRA